MCWVACDRLSRIAARLELAERAAYWRQHADGMHRTICERAWDETRQTFVASFGGESIDASLLLLNELGFLRADDPRFAATVRMVDERLRYGDFIMRYRDKDDFGEPQAAFLVCTFWFVDALVAIGRRDEARALFENLLRCRTALGLLSEHIDPVTGQLWGNFPQTYSMVGIISSAVRLSQSWEEGT
jgi:GH15 family glucan-1,4-alpha-glucosidase